MCDVLTGCSKCVCVQIEEDMSWVDTLSVCVCCVCVQIEEDRCVMSWVDALSVCVVCVQTEEDGTHSLLRLLGEVQVQGAGGGTAELSLHLAQQAAGRDWPGHHAQQQVIAPSPHQHPHQQHTINHMHIFSVSYK